MRNCRPSSKANSTIAAEWDAIAEERYRQLSNGIDISALLVIEPEMLRLARLSGNELILDVGCGVGWLTERLAQVALNVTAWDLSKQSIETAVAKSNSKNITWVIGDVASSDVSFGHDYDLAVSNMSLSAIVDVSVALRNIHTALRDGGAFVFSLPHPEYWPSYWGYSEAPWFLKDTEIQIECNFGVSLEPSMSFVTTHIHRPVAYYEQLMQRSGFILECWTEPFPSTVQSPLFPAPWGFPRFLFGRAVKVSKP
jgi:2-polyprenyl-3-methyl-5-hydroxy-6-metoxy-1,4-benzoquinol methylase